MEGDADKILGWPFRPCPIIAWKVSQLLNETVVDEVNARIYEISPWLICNSCDC
jgi:hypothetical protein